MMKSLKAAILAAGAFVIFSASSAFASTVTYTISGQGWIGGSWSASGTTLDTSGLGAPGSVVFNKAVFTKTGGNNSFEVGAVASAQGAGNIFVASFFTPLVGTSQSGTTATAGTVNMAAAGQSLAYKLILDGAGVAGDTISYKVDLFNGAVQTAFATVTSTMLANNVTQTIVQITDNIPVPPAVWTGVAMLGGMMFLVRRRNRKVLA
jgi:hypothetical protein